MTVTIDGPRTLHLDITNHCNTDCVTCWDHSPLLDHPREPLWKSRQADVEALLALVADAGALLPPRSASPQAAPSTQRALPALADRQPSLGAVHGADGGSSRGRPPRGRRPGDGVTRSAYSRRGYVRSEHSPTQGSLLGRLSAVIVSGMGEPLTHPRVYDLLAGLKAMGLHVTVITNLLAADANRLAAVQVDSLLVGIHAADAEGYRAFHPSSPAGAWDRLLDRLARRRQAGCRDKHVQVICARNAHALRGMVDLAAEFRAERVTFKLASLGGGTEAVRIDEGQRARLLAEWIPAAADRATELGVAHNLELFRAQVQTGGSATAPIRQVGCHMGEVYARVAVDGSVYFCCNTETLVGRLGEGTRFSDLWCGAAWDAMRDRLRRGEFFPGCERCGKFEQNVKLAAKKAARSSAGEAR